MKAINNIIKAVLIIALLSTVSNINAQRKSTSEFKNREIVSAASLTNPPRFASDGTNLNEVMPKHGNFNLYLQAFGGMTLDNPTLGAAIGWRFHEHFRAEAEFMYEVNEYGHNHAMASAVVDLLSANSWLMRNAKVNFYLKAGAGVAQQTNYFRFDVSHEISEDNVINISSTMPISKYNFAYNVGGGISWRVAPHFQIRGEVLYVGYPTEKDFMNKINYDLKEYSDGGKTYIFSGKALEQFHKSNFRGNNIVAKISFSYHF